MTQRDQLTVSGEIYLALETKALGLEMAAQQVQYEINLLYSSGQYVPPECGTALKQYCRVLERSAKRTRKICEELKPFV